MLKKILIAALLLPLLAFGQSYPSPTFNNLTVQGTFTASGKVGLASLAAQAANTVVANVTGSSASPTAVSVPNCSGTSSALTYTAGSGFSCNATINALTLGGATFAAPGPIGSTSTSSGAFSSISTPSATIGGGTINNTTIGATSASTGAFTTLNANANDALVYTTTNALSLASGSVVTVTTFTKVFDRVNANFNASTGVFTAPATGMYQACANFQIASAANVVGTRLLTTIQVNGSTQSGTGGATWQTTTATSQQAVTFCSLVNMSAGNTMTFVITQNTGGTRALDGTTVNWISINRIP